MTQEQIEVLCLEWQKRLRLQDWHVAIRLVPQYEIPDDWGQCNRNTLKKTAAIRIACPASMSTHCDHEFADEPEFVLIHELLHLTMAAFDRDEHTNANDVEQAINMIAEALLNAKRGNGHAVERALAAHDEGVIS